MSSPPPWGRRRSCSGRGSERAYSGSGCRGRRNHEDRAQQSIPAGAEAAVLEGDPSAEGEIFVFRIRFPAGYTLPPHFHPVDERVTVISGTFHLGMGRTLDRDRGRALSAGSQFLMPPGHAHYAWTEDEGAVIQLTSIGPWQIEYVDPADDPRLQGEGR